MYLATDLHGHSRFSDGTAEPEDFMDARHRAGVHIVALTDHDIFAGVPQAAATAEAHGQLLIPAMEATSFIHFGQSNAEQLHILAYFPPRMLQDGSLFQTFLYRRGLHVQQRWRDFVLTFLDALPTSDYDALDPQRQLQTRPATDFPGLQRLIDLVTKKRPQIFKHLIRSHVRFWTEDKALFGWGPEELIDAIRADGGIDIVAHPARYRDKERLARVLLGASGIEVYTSRHRPAWAAYFRDLAERLGKLWTASSDDHQKGAYQRPGCGTPLVTVERLLDAPVPAHCLTPALTQPTESVVAMAPP